ncbi:secreted trypsin-like serine protease [Saccharopolyspora lacisalsi]|uniref:Secreted trypsin-like serine protease n=1 Tax=Halosaccharopolyspora lacisalsi TaxID=1000566 RepID=A0A839E4J0_9PSEU|nr:trypsin-like serine protease [Halosaccharopolyspora lacisalsi]MBA8826647.1 secreted trypsin-like serine protease [Halosaccharopolyspora lacisalsi]
MSLTRTLTRVVGATVATLALVAPAQAASAAPPAPESEPMIIDGRNADEAPWAARMFADGRQACSATVVASEWILTAQHCVEGADRVSFHVGSLDQTRGREVVAKQGGVHVHPSADLALVNIRSSAQVTPAPLGSPGAAAVGETVQTYGWGATCTDRPEIECQSRLLKVADVTVTDNRCSDYRGGTAICARRGDGIPAGGDSGGPMFAQGSNGYVQVGVASTSNRSTRTAYTNVTQYRDWIRSLAGV